MKLLSLFLPSSIFLLHQHVVVASSSSSGKSQLRKGINNKETAVNEVADRELLVMTDSCALTVAELDFANHLAGVSECTKRKIRKRVKEVLNAKGCSSSNNDISTAVRELTGESNNKNAVAAIIVTCTAEFNGGGGGGGGGGDDDNNDDNDNGGSCTTIAQLSFRTIGKCNNSNIQNRVKEHMGASCGHNYNAEIQLLTGTTSTDAAKTALQNLCKSEFGCVADAFEVNGCDYRVLTEKLEKKLGSCPHDTDVELQKMTGTNTLDAAKSTLSSMCDDAFDEVDTSAYTDIDSRFTKSFMNQYVSGKTFLNLETGNFQGNQNKNPASEESLSAGQSIDNFYEDDASSTILLNNGWGDFQNCQYQSYMCCFGRDRQSNDDNGNCDDDNCEDADPGDNSNLCYTEPSNTAYFGEIEDDIHCHGLAWAEDGNDLISRFTMNNFFYVSMYDHMYQRGYVEPAVKGPDEPRMCGCIEDMPKVSRSDCTQVDVDVTFTFSRNVATGIAEVEAGDDVDIDFNACQGTDFDDGNNANNDLASYSVRLTNEGRMSTATQDKIFATLLGYADPGDNDNEAVCVAGYEQLTGRTHPCTNIDDTETNGCDSMTFLKTIEESLREGCPHGIEVELELLTGANSYANAINIIDDMCSDAWDMVAKTEFNDISNTFDNSFMKNYIQGDTFLNLETGNFQGQDTENSDPESVAAGEAISEYYESDTKGAKNSRLLADFPSASDQTSFESCAHQSIMCCFGRDRQFGDNNGNCAKNDCEDADPGDNSNLCYTEPSYTAYPKDSEGDVHCHGLAWAENENDFITQLKYNNFFYVSMYDHMYTRGYVQEMTYDQAENTDVVPMCGCIEDMHPVSRSDCTQVDVDQTFQYSIDENGLLQAEPKGDFEIEYNACNGLQFDDPDKRRNNDLASYVVRLVAEDKMTEATQTAIYETLVGYEKPGSNANENACKASYEVKTGLDYPRN